MQRTIASPKRIGLQLAMAVVLLIGVGATHVAAQDKVAPTPKVSASTPKAAATPKANASTPTERTDEVLQMDIPTPEDSVRAAESARAQALMHADTTALSRLVADEFVEVSRFGTLRTKADNIREIGSGALKLITVKYDSVTVRIYGDVAILRGIADNTGTLRGFPFAGKLWYTRVFVWRDGRWQAVAMQHTIIQ